MQLAMADIDGIDVAGAALPAALRKAAGGGAEIEATMRPCRREAEMIERGDQLQRAARDVRVRGLDMSIVCRSERLRRAWSPACRPRARCPPRSPPALRRGRRRSRARRGRDRRGWGSCEALSFPATLWRALSEAKRPEEPVAWMTVEVTGTPCVRSPHRHPRSRAPAMTQGSSHAILPAAAASLFAAERVQRRGDDGLGVEAGGFVHLLGRVLIDEAVGQRHGPDLQALVEQRLPAPGTASHGRRSRRWRLPRW